MMMMEVMVVEEEEGVEEEEEEDMKEKERRSVRLWSLCWLLEMHFVSQITADVKVAAEGKWRRVKRSKEEEAELTVMQLRSSAKRSHL